MQSVIIDEHNRRIKVMEYKTATIVSVDQEIEKLAAEKEMTKLTIYAKKADVHEWESLGYEWEGQIDGFFRGQNAQMMVRFVTPERSQSTAHEVAEEILQISLAKVGTSEKVRPLPDGYVLREATEEDAAELAALYGLVFATYPTPMNDPEYVLKTMRASTYYSVVEAQGKIVCAASAEVDEHFGSAELTDCATHPDYLGQGLLQPIFVQLEQKMWEMEIYYLYTLTRAQSHGMNITAAKHGYQYRGRLVNNCLIFSGYEDMNIWVKPLKETWE